MIIYNVTIKIDAGVESEWLEWMKNKHIPDVINTRQFSGSRISKLLDQPEDEDPTYIIQYNCESIEKYNHYINTFAAALRDEYNSLFKNKYVAFRTVMEVMG